MNNFFHASHILGSSPVFAQGGGGNTSVKIGYKMFVKASGVRLAAVAPGAGYTCCVHRSIASFLASSDHAVAEGERILNANINTHVLPDYHFGVPSIETGLHAVVPSKYVYHTHSVYANVFNCMEGGQHYLRDMFLRSSKSLATPVETLFVPYMNPGYELARYLSHIVQTRKNIPKLIFLQNHGLIAHHDDGHAALGLMRMANRRIAEYLHSQGIFTPFSVHRASADFSRHLFPDSAVYSQLSREDLPSGKKEYYDETASAANYILSTIKRLGETPRFIPGRDVLYIVGMEKEKHRLKSALA